LKTSNKERISFWL